MSTLRLATASNVRAFQILTEALDASDGKWSQWIESETLDDEVGRFRVWAGNLGALQKGHSSLDYRLRGSPVLFSSALRLLNELEQNLDETYAIVSEARLPYEQQKPSEGSDDDSDHGSSSEEEEDDSDSDEPRSELKMRYEEIVDIIDNLYKLSVRIRTPTVRSRSLKASAYTPIDPETGVDILGVYAELDRKHVRELLLQLRKTYPTQNEEDQDFLTERLSSSITLRRRHFKYWKRHRDKLGASADTEDIAAAGKPTLNEAPTPIRHDTLEAHPPMPTINTPKPTPSQKTGKTLLSGTEATHHHQSLDDIVDTKSVTSYAVTVKDLDGKGIDLPPPPKAATCDKDFECPYCWIVCPARYGKGRAWKTHLLQDLQPYICTHRDCESSEQLFRSRREWAEHEATHRKLWRCPEHVNALYNTQAGLENHLRQEHIGSFPDDQIAIMAKIGETIAVDSRDKCPICFVPTATEGLGDLQSHIANHLERLATFALPHGREDDEDGASSVASRGSSNSQSLPESISTGSSNEVVALNRDLEAEQSVETELNEEDRLLLQLRDEEHLSWEDIAARFRKAFGREYQISPLQMRIKWLKENPQMQPLQVADSSRSLLSAETLQQLPDESNNRVARISNQVDDIEDSEDEQPDNEQFDENILPEHQKHLEEREAFRQHVSSLPGVLSVRFYRGYGSWTGLITFANDLLGEEATALFDTERFPNVEFQSKKNKSKWNFTRFTGTDKKNAFSRQPTADTQTTEEANILPTESETYDEEDEESSKPAIITTAEIPTLRSLYQSRRLLQRDQSFAPNDAYNQMISFCHYDLTRLRVDAIVNNASANFQANPDPDSLHHAIYKAGGSALREEAKSKPKVKVGQVELTHGHNLPSSWVIHAAAPGYTGRKGVGQFNVLSECYRSAMRLAANYDFKTIAFPCLGTGGCMFPARVAARIALQEIREYLDSHPRHRPERIIFCVRAAIDEKAYTDFLPVFFPPTHGDLDRARTSDWSANRAALAAQVLEARTQLQNALTAVTVTYDFGTQSTVCAHDMRRIDSTLSSIRKYLLGSKELKRSLGDLNLLCSVILTACADIMDMAERARKQGPTGHTQSIWTEANTDIRAKHGFELTSVFDYSWIFANSLEEVLILGKVETDAMGRARQILETYGVKQKGQDSEGIRDHLDEVLYVREAERPTPKIRGLVQIHQIPPVARLYILGQLQPKPTMAKPSTLFNHTVCLLREDITRLEVDIVVNSTDPSFSGMGTLDRSIFKKGGDQLRSEVMSFGKCEEGDVKATAGYLLPAKHILHVVPPGVFRSDTKNILRNIYRAILHDAVLMRATSIAIPSLGTGMRNYPRRDCASLAMEEVKRFLESAEPGNGLDKIIFVVFSSNDEFIYKSLLPVYFPPTKRNTSPLNISRHLTEARESSSSLPATMDQPSPSISGEETSRSVRFGKQPVKSRAWNDDEAKTLMDFELHVGTCKVCEDGLYERTHKLCEPGWHFADAVWQRTKMTEDALVYSKGEQLEIPVKQLPSSMLLLSTIAKGGSYVFEDTSAQVEKPDTADPDTPVSEHPSVPNDPENITQATEQPAVVRVEVLSPHTDTGDWFYSWVRVFRSKIEMYAGDYDPDPYGESAGHTPYASIDLTDTSAELTRNDATAVSLWTAERRSELQARWQFRSNDAADSIALFELFKRALNRSRQEREKNVSAEIGRARIVESTIAAESGQEVLEDPVAHVNKPNAGELDNQVQTDDKATHYSEAEDTNVVAPDAGPRAVILVKVVDSPTPEAWLNSTIYVYKSNIIVEFGKEQRPEKPFEKIDLTDATLTLVRGSNGMGLNFPNMVSLHVSREGKDFESRETWSFCGDGDSNSDALFDILQQAVKRNSQEQKKATLNEVEEVEKSDPAKLDDYTLENDDMAYLSEAEDAHGTASATESPTVIQAGISIPHTSQRWTNSTLYVYKSSIDVYVDGSRYEMIDLLDASILKLQRGHTEDVDYANLAMLYVEASEERKRKGTASKSNMWLIHSDSESDANAVYSVIQRAVNRNSRAQEDPEPTESEEANNPVPTTPPIIQSEDFEETVNAESSFEANQRLGDIEYQIDDESRSGEESVPPSHSPAKTISDPDGASADMSLLAAKLDLDALILAYLNEDFRTRPGSYIGQKFEEITAAFEVLNPRLIAHVLQRLAAEGKVHNTVDGETWVISEPTSWNSELSQEERPEKPKGDLADRILLCIDRVGGWRSFSTIIGGLQTTTDELRPALKGLATVGLISSRAGGMMWGLTDLGRTRVLDLQAVSTEAGQEIAQDPGSSPHVGTSTISQQLVIDSLKPKKQPPSEESNTIAEERGYPGSQPEKDSNQDEDASNNLADRALSYLRGLPGLSGNISDLATTFDTPVTELQPVLEQLGSDGLVENTENESTWTAISPELVRVSPRSPRTDLTPHSTVADSNIFTHPNRGYNRYPCPNWQKESHPSDYSFVDKKDELCAHCNDCMDSPSSSESELQAPKREDASVESAVHDDDTPTTHIQSTGSGSSIMDAAIASGQIYFSEFFSYDNRPWNHTPLPRTQIDTSLVDERVLIEAAFRPEKEPGVYYIERKVGPEEVEEWVRQTKELQEKDSQVPKLTLTKFEDLVVHDTSPQSPPLPGSAHVLADDFLASPSQRDASESAVTDAEIQSNASIERTPHETPEKPGAYWTRIHQRLVDARVLEEEGEAFDIRGDSLFLPRVLKRREIRAWAEKTRGLRKKQGESELRPEEGGIQCYQPKATSSEVHKADKTPLPSGVGPALHPTARSPNTSQAGSWRDGRGTKERERTKSSRALTGDIEEDMESGTASSLRRAQIVRERKHSKSSKAKKDDIDDELEDYDGQEEDFVDDQFAH
ncbi:hypothetical protein J4E91_007674 [Alternaria rosae]|nr:hypothetical protein J4E91_007674 [Alternaria rosae]